ncbi:hypothetical protein NDU88_007099 [Pleurodeles waltl]|uniref:Uncharacterized protein n=1 Tax=Pleurodeles waltl TaxID=8319 RepID=A0AAV7VRT6_PLEWA|nr:hypothetical protein NDU88_007099 [Pleurodeles waltl]
MAAATRGAAAAVCGAATAAAVAAMRRCPGGNCRCGGCRDEESGSHYVRCSNSGSGCGYAPLSWRRFSLRWLPRRGKQQRASAALSSGGRGLQASPLRRHQCCLIVFYARKQQFFDF